MSAAGITKGAVGAGAAAPGAARAILDELLAAEREWLPQFHGGPPAA